VSTRYYLQNAAAPYTPTTKRGAWDDATSTVAMGLGSRSGTSATKSRYESNVSNTWDGLLARLVSAGLAAACTVNLEDFCIGIFEDVAAADMVPHLHIYVTTGDSDTPRGTILTDWLGSSEVSTSYATAGYAATPTTQNPVSASAGDRIVVEVGYQARNSVTTLYQGVMYVGATGGTDLTQGAAANTYPGWFDFTLEAAASSCPPNLLRTHYLCEGVM
jgi:hypothetical protein